MKRYGQAEYACYLLEKFVQEKLTVLTAEQKELCIKKLREQAASCFPSTREVEVGG